jgi:hypothetical protein
MAAPSDADRRNKVAVRVRPMMAKERYDAQVAASTTKLLPW